jgi:rhodanese-related sulfurtransferase
MAMLVYQVCKKIVSSEINPRYLLMKTITIQQKPALIIDVRMPEEYAQGHIEGSVNIPLPYLMKEVSQIKTYREVCTETYKDVPTIYVCCASGGRSAVAADMLEQVGIPLVEDGGGWQELSCRCTD